MTRFAGGNNSPVAAAGPIGRLVTQAAAYCIPMIEATIPTRKAKASPGTT